MKPRQLSWGQCRWESLKTGYSNTITHTPVHYTHTSTHVCMPPPWKGMRALRGTARVSWVRLVRNWKRRCKEHAPSHKNKAEPHWGVKSSYFPVPAPSTRPHSPCDWPLEAGTLTQKCRTHEIAEINQRGSQGSSHKRGNGLIQGPGYQ